MTPLTDNQRCNAIGLADGYTQATVPGSMPDRPRLKLSNVLSWPIELVSPEHLFAYFDGVYEGRQAFLEDNRAA